MVYWTPETTERVSEAAHWIQALFCLQSPCFCPPQMALDYVTFDYLATKTSLLCMPLSFSWWNEQCEHADAEPQTTVASPSSSVMRRAGMIAIIAKWQLQKVKVRSYYHNKTESRTTHFKPVHKVKSSFSWTHLRLKHGNLCSAVQEKSQIRHHLESERAISTVISKN